MKELIEKYLEINPLLNVFLISKLFGISEVEVLHVLGITNYEIIYGDYTVVGVGAMYRKVKLIACINIRDYYTGNDKFEIYPSGGFRKYTYDDRGRELSAENDKGFYRINEYCEHGRTYTETSSGYWERRVFNDAGKVIEKTSCNDKIE